jgi:hypothetical protein
VPAVTVKCHVLEETGNQVISSDWIDHGFSEIGHDFLTTDHKFPNIITNPPFHSGEGFVASSTIAPGSAFSPPVGCCVSGQVGAFRPAVGTIQANTRVSLCSG